MNLPNKLTLARIVIVPFFVAAMLVEFPFHYIAALILFIIASVTDMLDGKIARSRNLVTDFGKFADPLADKILVLAALLCFVQNGLCDCVAVIIILFREFEVTSIRLIAASKGKVVAANIFGKIKTVLQLTAIIYVLVMQALSGIAGEFAMLSAEEYNMMSQIIFVSGEVLIWISTLMAIISGVIYTKQNYQFISEM